MKKTYTLEQTTCLTHFQKRAKIEGKDALNSYEKEKNCCPDCDKKRIEAWDRPTDKDIERRAKELLGSYRNDPVDLSLIINEFESYASVEEDKVSDILDRRVWSQFSDVESGNPYYIGADYRKLVNQLRGI